MLRSRSFLGSVTSTAFIKQFEWVQAPLGRPAQIATTIWTDCVKQRPAILVLSRAARAFEDMAVDAGLPEFPRDAVRALANPAVAPTVKRWIAFAKAQFGVAIERAQASMPERVELNSHAGAIALRLLFQTWHLGQLAEVWYHENHFFDEVVSCTQSDVGVFCTTRAMANDPDAPRVDRKKENGSSDDETLDFLTALFSPPRAGGDRSPLDMIRRLRSRAGAAGNNAGARQVMMDDLTESFLASMVGPERAAHTRRRVERARSGIPGLSPEMSELAERLGVNFDEVRVVELKPGESISDQLDEIFGRRRRPGEKAETKPFSVGSDEPDPDGAPGTDRPNPTEGTAFADDLEVPVSATRPPPGAPPAAPANFPPPPTEPAPDPAVTRLSTPNVNAPPSSEG